jgi:DNA-binding SARP family transcriptional activator
MVGSRATTAGEFRTVLTVRMLGSLVVTLNGTVVDTESSRRTRQLLAYLLLHRRVAVPRDVLMDTFWPAASPEAARNNLHVALSGVRQALRAASPVSLLQRRHDTYRLDSDLVWLDVEEFEQRCAEGRRADRAGDMAAAARCYAAADRLYEGDVLAEDPYLDWASQQREALRLEFLNVQRRLVELYSAAGDHDSAVMVARRALVIDPYDEALHRRLMLAFHDLGQLHLALAQYQRCADLLWQAFRVRPSPQTVRLNERLRRHEPAVAASKAPADGYIA